MEQAAAPENLVLCTQCGGELHPDEGQIFLTCPYCSSTVYLDKARVVFHWYLAATLDENKARGALARWMSGNQTVKDLDTKAKLAEIQFEYFPIWYIKRRKPGGQDEVLLRPAAATSVTELQHLRLPAGDLRKYESSLDSQAHTPTVPVDTVVSWLKETNIPENELVERALVHIPLYTCKYIYNDQTYTALVDGATGTVLANIFPAKQEAPYAIAGAVSAVVFLCLALAPVAGILSGGNGTGIGIGVCVAGGIVAAPFLMALAAWVASRI
jgi:predicted RNA-binding Zn-ribbon protein involved in translation (DUF1610 family)